MTQKVDSKPCDVDGCQEMSTSYSPGQGRYCDKHYSGPEFNPDLKGRREDLKRHIIAAILYHEIHRTTLDEVAEKILSELDY